MVILEVIFFNEFKYFIFFKTKLKTIGKLRIIYVFFIKSIFSYYFACFNKLRMSFMFEDFMYKKRKLLVDMQLYI